MLKIRDLGVGFPYLMCGDPSGGGTPPGCDPPSNPPQCNPSGPRPGCPGPSGPPPPCGDPSGIPGPGGGKKKPGMSADAAALLRQQLHRQLRAQL